MIELIIMVGIWCLFGVWCHSIAKKNGRKTTLAFWMGFLFSWIAVIVYYVKGPTLEQQGKNYKKVIESVKGE